VAGIVYVPFDENSVAEMKDVPPPPPPDGVDQDPSPRRNVVELGVPLALIFATVTTELSMVQVAPEEETVMSPLSPSLTPPPPPISTTVPLSFFVNSLPSAVLIANSPATRLPADGVALAVLLRL
jgi:hypothetical protein